MGASYNELYNSMKRQAIMRLTKEYSSILRDMKYSDSYAFVRENKDCCEYDKVIAAESIKSFDLLRKVVKEICDGEKAAYRYKYYYLSKFYKAYEDILVEIGSWGNLYLLIGACAIANRFSYEREWIEPITEYITAMLSIHFRVGRYEDIMRACMTDNVAHTVSDIVFEEVY